ncbi:MAG TPA: SpoIIE family protein phosphatase [Bryobacteraceae bacterium]|nr:SpoIIE family protein phosphatase [Bryobacteraceae bacterium]
MNQLVRILRLVVASPGDVAAERRIVPTVVDELNKSVCADRGLRIETIRWETDAFPGFHPEGPQGLIDGILRLDACDILVGIFWRRFGSPVQDADSGTEHELRLAYRSYVETGRPHLMVYFNQEPATPQSPKDAEQWVQVLRFHEELEKKDGLCWNYSGAANFESLLRQHLSHLLRSKFPLQQSETAQPQTAQQNRKRAEYFHVQTRILEESTTSVVRRTQAVAALDNFLNSQSRGYFLVRGGPGQGKTVLSCDLVKTRLYVHHLINRNGGRADPRLILRSLLAQFPADGDAAIPEPLSELTKVFEEKLQAVAASANKAVILIDALDEIPEDQAGDPPYLAVDGLPDGVFFVITSRSGNRLSRLQQRLFATPHKIYDLGPLEPDQMRQILVIRKPDISDAEIERIADASQGNPLYLRAVGEELARDSHFDLSRLPASIEGFFQQSVSSLQVGNRLLADVLGLLSVARKPLSVNELGGMLNVPQREIHDAGIRPVQQFLLQAGQGYTFYHFRFHEFVTRTLLYEDELRRAHRAIADWLLKPENRGMEYRVAALAYHLFESKSYLQLIEAIDEDFLRQKVRRLGYGVLEDVELHTRALLEIDSPDLIERCVSLVEAVREVAGGDIVADLTLAAQPYRAGPRAMRTKLIEPPVPGVAGIQMYVGLLPKLDISADFFEIVDFEGRLAIAIGDVPSIGLRSSFAARFLANMFRRIATTDPTRSVADFLSDVSRATSKNEYFRRISMQCIKIDLAQRTAWLASAGHPFPVHYSARRQRCDILPIRGALLNSSPQGKEMETYEEYAVEIAPGDVLILLTDGITEGHVMKGEAYGYRFLELVKAHAKEGARAVGEAILDAWQAHCRDEDTGDDVTIVVAAIQAGGNS